MEIFSETFSCNSTDALCNRTLEPEAEGGGDESKQLQFPIISALVEGRYWHAMMCVNLTRAPPLVARPRGTHRESREEEDQDVERNAAAVEYSRREREKENRCKTPRGGVKRERNRVWVTEWVRLSETERGEIARMKLDDSVGARRDGWCASCYLCLGSVLNCRAR